MYGETFYGRHTAQHQLLTFRGTSLLVSETDDTIKLGLLKSLLYM